MGGVGLGWVLRPPGPTSGQWRARVAPLSLVINARPTFRVFVLLAVAPLCTTAKCALRIYIVPFEWRTAAATPRPPPTPLAICNAILRRVPRALMCAQRCT